MIKARQLHAQRWAQPVGPVASNLQTPQGQNARTRVLARLRAPSLFGGHLVVVCFTHLARPPLRNNKSIRTSASLGFFPL